MSKRIPFYYKLRNLSTGEFFLATYSIFSIWVLSKRLCDRDWELVCVVCYARVFSDLFLKRERADHLKRLYKNHYKRFKKRSVIV